MVIDHADATDSTWSNSLLEDWDRVRGRFWQIIPKEMLTRLPAPLIDEAEEAVAAE